MSNTYIYERTLHVIAVASDLFGVDDFVYYYVWKSITLYAYIHIHVHSYSLILRTLSEYLNSSGYSHFDHKCSAL